VSSPEFNRELIRLANRDRLDAGNVIDLLIFADFSMARTGMRYDLIEPHDIYSLWKGSLDEDSEP
jgi:hypothetical protein